MTIKKTDAGWTADIQPGGRGAKRFRKSFKTKAEALAWQAWLISQVNQSPEWQPERRDTRRLSELVDAWHKLHGMGLRSGEDTHRRLSAMAKAMGDPIADRFSADVFASYRQKRIAQGITPANMNREHAYARAMFNELSRLGHWKRANPLTDIRQFKVNETELSFLSIQQIQELLSIMRSMKNPHVLLITRICLATGARWSEAEQLRKTQVRSNVIQYARTKSGKTRAVPISGDLYQAITSHAQQFGSMGRIFGYAYHAFETAIARSSIELPEGQMTHVLRHTFASHFMMNGGNILTLQRILGHSSIQMTMRYAHLAPDHLQEAKTLNPLAALTLG